MFLLLSLRRVIPDHCSRCLFAGGVQPLHCPHLQYVDRDVMERSIPHLFRIDRPMT